jgi:hypothetical protein
MQKSDWFRQPLLSAILRFAKQTTQKTLKRHARTEPVWNTIMLLSIAR